MAKNEQDKLIDEWVAEVNSCIGDTMIPEIGEYPPHVDNFYGSQINEWVTTDLIRHYVDSIGDRNPLWRNEEYARRTRWGGIIAPPTFTDSIVQPYTGVGPYIVGQPFRDPDSIFDNFHIDCWGTRRELFQVIRPGDRMRAILRFLGVKETDAEQPAHWGSARTFIKAYRTTIINQREEVVALSDYKRIIHINNPLGPVTTQNPVWPKPEKRRRLTDEERDAIDRGYAEEKRRGADILFWENVSEGEEFKLHLIGPYNICDSVTFWTAIAGHMVAFDFGWERRNARPGYGMLDPETNGWIAGGIVHLVDMDNGLSGGPAVGFFSQIEGLLGRMICNWMGDDGFLKLLDCEFPSYPIHGEVFSCKGLVKNKYTEGVEHLVALEVRCENMDGMLIGRGNATVRLPSRTDTGD